jgi:hypothetical protein
MRIGAASVPVKDHNQKKQDEEKKIAHDRACEHAHGSSSALKGINKLFLFIFRRRADLALIYGQQQATGGCRAVRHIEGIGNYRFGGNAGV